MGKRRIGTVIGACLLAMVFLLNIFKKPFVLYLPFDIPGAQMAATIPPFGIFIEARYEDEDRRAPCSVLTHENVHWEQYRRMGLLSFYFHYLKGYLEHGRKGGHWMEREANIPCKGREKQRKKARLGR